MSLDTTIPDSALRTENFSINGVVFLVPRDAPLPNELTEAHTEGTLYERIAPLAKGETGSATSVVAVSGQELLALVAAWRALTLAKRVFVLTGLPAARYDVTFTQAARAIGIRSVDWIEVTDSLQRAKVDAQRTRDTTPWAGDVRADGSSARAPGFPRRRGAGAALDEPSSTDDSDVV